MYLLGQTNNGVDGTFVVQVAASAVVTRADSTDALVRSVLVAIKNSPSRSGGQIGNGGG